MPADLYSDAAPAAAESPAAEAPEAAEESAPQEEQPQDNETTAELPKAILGGKEFKPGEEVVLQVVQVTENSVIVKYASGEGEGEYGEGEEAPAAAPAPQAGPMSSMLE